MRVVEWVLIDPIPQVLTAAIETGTTEQLERYAERIVVVDTLAAVFADD